MFPLPGLPEAVALGVAIAWFTTARSQRPRPAEVKGHRKDPVPNPNPSPDPVPENDPEADPERHPVHEPEPEPEPVTAGSGQRRPAE